VLNKAAIRTPRGVGEWHAIQVARVCSTRAICAQQTVTAKPVFFGAVSTKNDRIGSPDWARGRARNKCLPHTRESWNVAGRTREYRGGLRDRSGRSDHAGQKPAPTGGCRERRWQKASSCASLLKQSAARYEADNATGLVSLSPIQRSSEATNHRQAYRNLNLGVIRSRGPRHALAKLRSAASRPRPRF
jgi:hypothetical protein